MRGLLISLQFLTQLPVHTEKAEPRDIADSYYFYPVIGLLIGVAAVLLRRALMLVFPLSFSVTILIAFLVWISGGLHEDGLADVADGMGGGWTRDQRLTIMKDSRIGSFGAAVLVLALLAKYTALTSMSTARMDLSIITAQVLGRWAFLPMGYFNPSAHEGLGSDFMKGLSATAVVVGTAFAFAVAILIGRFDGVVACGAATAVIVLASTYFRSRLGGITGDCFGATFQFVEIATYAIFLT
jgi:adenosylcobinamide-GDP ribazoletransferase